MHGTNGADCLALQVYWLLVSAIWGTIKLFPAKQAAVVEEDSWAFGQVLPAFLLLAPLFTTAEIFSELWRGSGISDQGSITDSVNEVIVHDDHSDPHHLPEETAPTQPTMPPDTLEEGDTMQLETRRFQGLVRNNLNRDYYHHKSCIWIRTAVALACLQIIAVTVLFLFDLVSHPGGGAASLLVYYSIIILLVSPSCLVHLYFALR